jgi:glucan biosynthesis protein C
LGISGLNPLYLLVRATISWSCLLTFLGFASHHLNFRSRFQNYANKVVLPFYILHQTVIVVIGFFILDWNLSVFPKYLILMAASFIFIIAIYEIFIKRLNFMRLLFGMKV